MTPVQTSLTVECKVHFTQVRHGRKQMAVGGPLPAPATVRLGACPVSPAHGAGHPVRGLVQRRGPRLRRPGAAGPCDPGPRHRRS